MRVEHAKKNITIFLKKLQEKYLTFLKKIK
jgi:hypothetical protein